MKKCVDAGFPEYEFRAGIGCLIFIAVLLYANNVICSVLNLQDSAFDGAGRILQIALGDTSAGAEEERAWTTEELKEMLAGQTDRPIQSGTARHRKKDARLAMLCSLVFPGLGQIYNERPYKAVIAMGVETFYLSKILLNHRYSQRSARMRDSTPDTTAEWASHAWWAEEYKERRLDWIWWSAGVFVVLILDAYIDAHLSDMDFKVEGIRVEEGAGVGVVIGF